MSSFCDAQESVSIMSKISSRFAKILHRDTNDAARAADYR